MINAGDIKDSLGVMGKDIKEKEIQEFMDLYGEPDTEHEEGVGVTYDKFKCFLLDA